MGTLIRDLILGRGDDADNRADKEGGGVISRSEFRRSLQEKLVHNIRIVLTLSLSINSAILPPPLTKGLERYTN